MQDDGKWFEAAVEASDRDGLAGELGPLEQAGQQRRRHQRQIDGQEEVPFGVGGRESGVNASEGAGFGEGVGETCRARNPRYARPDREQL